MFAQAQEHRIIVSPDLSFHGDQELGPDLVDLAVNVRLTAPPAWLARVVTESVARLGAYPDPQAAVTAIAAYHGVDPTMVLPTAGGAEAFSLLARARVAERPLIVHPQFTEPDLAFRAVGAHPEHLVLEPTTGFRLPPDSPGADLIVIGNPTNPTGVLHPAAKLRRWRHPGRVLVVDEAFMDAVPGEPASLIGPDMSGVLVIRSLTKTWGLAGLRAGYVIGDPALIKRLRDQQPPWSVSTPALAATVAVCSERGRRESEAAARAYADHRAVLSTGLRALGLTVAGADPQTPFLLVRTGAGIRQALRDRGFAVRRGDTFPGLDASWIRVAVRDPGVSECFLAALAEVLQGPDDRSTGAAV